MNKYVTNINLLKYDEYVTSNDRFSMLCLTNILMSDKKKSRKSNSTCHASAVLKCMYMRRKRFLVNQWTAQNWQFWILQFWFGIRMQWDQANFVVKFVNWLMLYMKIFHEFSCISFNLSRQFFDIRFSEHKSICTADRMLWSAAGIQRMENEKTKAFHKSKMIAS